MTDQQRWDTLSCVGAPVETANLDHIAANGTVFTRAYSASPSCLPARASLMTGMDPWHTGILGMGPDQPVVANLRNTLSEALGNAGWHTQGVGKMHFSPQRSLQGFHNTVLDETIRAGAPGFVSDYARWFDQNKPADCERYGHGIDVNSWLARPYHLPEYLHATAWTAAESIRFLERRDPTRPFMLKMSFDRPHSPYDPPPFYFDLYTRKAATDPRLGEPAVGKWAAVHDVPADASDVNAWHGRRSPEQVTRARAAYYGSVHFIDDQIGRVRQFLRKNKLDDNTVIVFTSDHGDMLGDHHLWRKTYAYEGSAHIPLIVQLPKGMRDGIHAESDAPVGLKDIMPTILDACGVDIPDTVDGASLLTLINGDDAGWREFIHGEHGSQYDPSNEMQYLTDGRWKYIWFLRTGTEQLFNLSTDPYECNDLAAEPDHSGELETWRQRLVAILAERDAGLTAGDDLVCQAGRPPLISPHAAERQWRAAPGR